MLLQNRKNRRNRRLTSQATQQLTSVVGILSVVHQAPHNYAVTYAQEILVTGDISGVINCGQFITNAVANGNVLTITVADTAASGVEFTFDRSALVRTPTGIPQASQTVTST